MLDVQSFERPALRRATEESEAKLFDTNFVDQCEVQSPDRLAL
jgi:hypothetical protein